MNFETQAETFLTEIADRKSDPVRRNTLLSYRSILDARILPAIGKVDMTDIGNKTVKMLVARLSADGLSPATITLAVTLVKQVVKSAVDEEGNQIYPRTWNTRFIDAPRVDPTAQKAPTVSNGALQAAVGGTNEEVRVLVALLAGTGLRIGEALALKVGDVKPEVDSFWDMSTHTLTIQSTMVVNQVQNATKTKAGTRVVDLGSDLDSLLHTLLPRTGFLFQTKERTLRRRIAALGIPGFHSMRRFRITHLEQNNVPRRLIKFWSGHAAEDISERYMKNGQDIENRKDWSEKAGLGFQI